MVLFGSAGFGLKSDKMTLIQEIESILSNSNKMLNKSQSVVFSSISVDIRKQLNQIKDIQNNIKSILENFIDFE